MISLLFFVFTGWWNVKKKIKGVILCRLIWLNNNPVVNFAVRYSSSIKWTLGSVMLFPIGLYYNLWQFSQLGAVIPLWGSKCAAPLFNLQSISTSFIVYGVVNAYFNITYLYMWLPWQPRTHHKFLPRPPELWLSQPPQTSPQERPPEGALTHLFLFLTS